MSVLRISRPGHETVLIPLDDGATGRITHTRYGLRGGSIYGAFPVGESRRAAQQRQQRESIERARLARQAESREGSRDPSPLEERG